MTATMNGTAPVKPDPVAAKVAATLRVDDLRAKSWKVTLPGNEWAVLCDPATVTNGRRRKFKEAGTSIGMLTEKIEVAMATGNVAVVEALTVRQGVIGAGLDLIQVAMFVTSWSFSLPTPTPDDLSSLDALPGLAFDRLFHVTSDLLDAVFFNDETTAMDVDSPFPASDDLSTPS